LYRLTLLLSIIFTIISCSQKLQLSKNPDPQLQKITIDMTFRSEGVIASDINNDNLLDIVLGDVWYEAPNWKMHDIRPYGDYVNTTYDDAKPSGEYAYYSNSFAVYTEDVDGDGWQDVLTFPTMGQPIYWYKNPQNSTGKPWVQGQLTDDYHGESPLQVDLFGTGHTGILCGVNENDSLYQLEYMMKNDKGGFKHYAVGHTSKYSYDGPFWGKRIKHAAAGAFAHGLGTGDINADGHMDIITRNGWYEGPQDGSKYHFEFHPVPFDKMADAAHPQLQFAQMLVFDVDQDGDNDVFGSSAHRHGIWWFEHIEEDGTIKFIKHELPIHISQVHALALGDLNNNGVPDVITGKRYLAHNGNDPGWDEDLLLLWIEPYNDLSNQTQFNIIEIDKGVGVGTQIQLVDMNQDNRDDILVSNKTGTHLFLQKQ